MMTKEQVLQHMKEVDKKVVDQKAEFDRNVHQQVESFKKEIAKWAEVAEGLKKQLADGQVDFEAMKAGYERKLEGYEDLEKALVKIAGPAVAAGRGQATLTNTVTELTEHDVKKSAEFNTDSIRGKAISVIAHGKQERKWKVTEVKEAIEGKWGTVDGKSLGIELMRAVVDDGILARVDDGHSHFLYFLPENVTLKEKS